MYEPLVLVLALSVDLFVTCIAYGSCLIVLPRKVILLFSGMGSLCLGLSLEFGTFLSAFFPPDIPRILGSLCLGALGVGKLADYLRKRKQQEKPELQALTVREALLPALAMSADSLVAGLGLGFWESRLLSLLLASFFAGLLAAHLGAGIGRRLAEKSHRELSWLSGVLLIALAAQKMFR